MRRFLAATVLLLAIAAPARADRGPAPAAPTDRPPSRPLVQQAQPVETPAPRPEPKAAPQLHQLRIQLFLAGAVPRGSAINLEVTCGTDVYNAVVPIGDGDIATIDTDISGPETLCYAEVIYDDAFGIPEIGWHYVQAVFFGSWFPFHRQTFGDQPLGVYVRWPS